MNGALLSPLLLGGVQPFGQAKEAFSEKEARLTDAPP